MIRILASLIVTCALSASSAIAFSPEARGAGQGGAYSAFAEGAEGIWWNPAVLGEQLVVSASLGAGLEAGNNALSLSRIVDLISSPTDAKKRDVVNDIRKLKVEDNELWQAAINAGGLGGVSIKVPGAGSFALGITPRVMLKAADVTADTVEFALFYDPSDLSTFPPSAPEIRRYEFGGKFTRSAFMEIGLGYAREIPEPVPAISLSAGLNIKYFYGLDYTYAMTDQVFDFGSLVLPTSQSEYLTGGSGKGFGADLGLHAKILGSIKAAIVVRNIGAKIKWDVEGERGTFNQSTLKFESYSFTGTKEQDLPTVVSLAAGGSVPVVGTMAGVQADIGPSDEGTRIGLGLSQKLMGVFSLRLGYAYNSDVSSSMITGGLGLGALAGGFDLAGGFAPDGKSAAFSLSGSVAF